MSFAGTKLASLIKISEILNRQNKIYIFSGKLTHILSLIRQTRFKSNYVNKGHTT